MGGGTNTKRQSLCFDLTRIKKNMRLASHVLGLVSQVELTWHPTLGLTMYINGRRADYETYPRQRAAITNTDWRTYLGRPLNDADGSYANTLVDNMEFYNAYRTYIPEDSYLSLLGSQPPYIPPVVTQRPRPAITERPTGIIIGGRSLWLWGLLVLTDPRL